MKTCDNTCNIGRLSSNVTQPKTTKLIQRLEQQVRFTSSRQLYRRLLSNKRPPTYSSVIMLGYT